VRSIAATWYGSKAFVGGAGVLIVGMITHFSNSAFWGVIFAGLPLRRKSLPVMLLGGLVWGVVIWATMSHAIMPWLNPTMYAGTVREDPGWWFVLHLIYGGTLGVTSGWSTSAQALSGHKSASVLGKL